jgi:hypothetical protein
MIHVPNVFKARLIHRPAIGKMQANTHPQIEDAFGEKDALPAFNLVKNRPSASIREC